jgi:hypothetical protein
MAQPPHGSVPPRFQQGPLTTALQLGPLAFLAGSWPEPGFNAIWRPDNPQSRPLTPPPIRPSGAQPGCASDTAASWFGSSVRADHGP